MDLLLFQYLNSLAGEWGWLDTIVIFFAEYLAYWLIGGLLALAIWYRKSYGWKMFFWSLVAAVFSRLFITEIIRFFYDKLRPFEVLDIFQLLTHSSGGAFPSGHAAFFFALSTIIFLYNKKWGSVFITATILMTLSRVIVGIHWPYDILGGAVIGVLSGIFVVYIGGKFFKK